jgi:hypothetical protein
MITLTYTKHNSLYIIINDIKLSTPLFETAYIESHTQKVLYRCP